MPFLAKEEEYGLKFIEDAKDVRTYRLDEADNAYYDEHITLKGLEKEEKWINFQYYKSVFTFGLL